MSKDNFDLTLIKKHLNKKKRVNSRSKGNTFERKICALLNNKFNTTEFCRSPGSGAFATTHSLPDYLKVYGDLITPKNFKFIIECKKGYNKININSILNNSSELWEFIKQSERDSKVSGKPALIVYQQDRQPALIIYKKELFYSLPNTITFEDTINKVSYTKYNINLLEDILNIPNHFFFD
jgi:Holliday junction resolvase